MLALANQITGFEQFLEVMAMFVFFPQWKSDKELLMLLQRLYLKKRRRPGEKVAEP